MWYSYTKFIFAGKKDVLNILNDNSLISQVNQISNIPKFQTTVAYFLNQNIPDHIIKNCIQKLEFIASKNTSFDIWATKTHVRLFGKNFTNWEDFSKAVDDLYVPLHQKESLNKQVREQKIQQKQYDDFSIHQKNSIIVVPINDVSDAVKYGQGTPWCIAQPGNTLYFAYRTRNHSTFYFVFDNTRDDALSRVAVDISNSGTHLTDLRNTTGTIFEFGKDWKLYFKYLQDHGIDTSQFKNKPLTEEEKEENKFLSTPIDSLEDFIQLPAVIKIKYIAWGNRLTDDQLKYLIDNKMTKILLAYVSTGISLLPHHEAIIKKYPNIYKTYQRQMNIAEDIMDNFLKTNPDTNRLSFIITHKNYDYIRRYIEKTPHNLRKSLVQDIFDTFETIREDELVNYSQIETDALIYLLVPYGLDVNLAMGYLKETPQTIQYLIDNGANIKDICRQVKKFENIKYLVEQVKVDPSTFYPLTWVDNPDKVEEYLIQHGANKITAFFNTHIDYYSSRMRPSLKDVLEYFNVSNLDEIVDQKKTNINNDEAVEWMMRNGLSPEAGIYLSKNFLNTSQIIRDYKIDYNEYVRRFYNGNPNAAVALGKNWAASYALLLNTNCNPRSILQKKFSAFLNNEEIIKKLLERGVDPNDYLKYLIINKPSLYNTNDINILVEAGADLNIGLTTMLSQVFRGGGNYNYNMIKLIQLGVDPTKAERGIFYGGLTVPEAGKFIELGVDPQYIYDQCRLVNNTEVAKVIAEYHKV